MRNIRPEDIEILRIVFEEVIVAPPYEKSVSRHGEESAWPGNYKDYDVQLAFDVYLDGVFSLIEEKKKLKRLN